MDNKTLGKSLEELLRSTIENSKEGLENDSNND